MWRDFGYTNNWWCGPGAFLPGPFGMLVTIFFWILIAVVIAWLFQTFFRKKLEGSSSTMEILRTRYAQGEISKEEFEQMKQALK